MESVLHAIAALPGDGRYAVTFRRADGSEQTAVVHLRAEDVEVAEASLPAGWTTAGEAFAATAAAVRAVDAARRATSAPATLQDVEGGWDVSLGNVVLDANGEPCCTAHGAMTVAGDRVRCPECGSEARVGR